MAQAVSTVTQVRAISAPAKAWLWEFVIPQVPAGVGDAAEELTFRAQASALPGRAVGQVLTYYMGHEIVHPTRNKFEHSFPVRFVEGLNGRVGGILEAWFEAYLSEADGSSTGEPAMKTDAFMRMLNHSKEVVRQYHLYDFFVLNWPTLPVGYDSETLVNFEPTFAYSYWLSE
jgi:hypothetical protein